MIPVPVAAAYPEKPKGSELHRRKSTSMKRRRSSLGSERPDDAVVIMRLAREDFARYLVEDMEIFNKLAVSSMKREREPVSCS